MENKIENKIKQMAIKYGAGISNYENCTLEEMLHSIEQTILEIDIKNKNLHKTIENLCSKHNSSIIENIKKE